MYLFILSISPCLSFSLSAWSHQRTNRAHQPVLQTACDAALKSQKPCHGGPPQFQSETDSASTCLPLRRDGLSDRGAMGAPPAGGRWWRAAARTRPACAASRARPARDGLQTRGQPGRHGPMEAIGRVRGMCGAWCPHAPERARMLLCPPPPSAPHTLLHVQDIVGFIRLLNDRVSSKPLSGERVVSPVGRALSPPSSPALPLWPFCRLLSSFSSSLCASPHSFASVARPFEPLAPNWRR